MEIGSLPIPIVASLALLLALAGLVLAKRLTRSHAERVSRGRRQGWLDALGPGPDAGVRPPELRALARGARRSLAAQDDLLTLLKHGDLPPPDGRQLEFVRALKLGGLEGALLAALAGRSAMARGRAALLAARLGLPGADAAVAPLLADDDRDVRTAATQALATCGTERAADALLDALRRGLIEPERVVERLTGGFAVGPLLRALDRPEMATCRPWLAEALGLTGDARAELPLTMLLNGRSDEERIRACRGLGRLGFASSCDSFLGALEDPAAGVRAQAARALGALGDKRGLSPLTRHLGDSSWWVRARSAEALLNMGEAGTAALQDCADDHPDRFARERAAEALAR